jgi:carbonic anhydrase
MKKLINGIVAFRQKYQKEYREAFGKLATGQFPDTLFIACSDSRVVPNTFASTDPGDLFVLRNVGNLVPPCGDHGISSGDESEAAAIEYAIRNLNVRNIIVCGHSECGAMRAIIDDRERVQSPNLRSWLRHGDTAMDQLQSGLALDESITPHNQLSQLNVLLQLEHIKSYPIVGKRLKDKTIALHGLWFDIEKADVYAYEEEWNKFVLIDETEATRLLSRVDP